MTVESARLLATALRALDGCVDHRETELVREALLRGPKDRADPLRLATFGEGDGSRRAFEQLSAVVEAAGVPRHWLLYLVTTGGRRRSGATVELNETGDL